MCTGAGVSRPTRWSLRPHEARPPPSSHTTRPPALVPSPHLGRHRAEGTKPPPALEWSGSLAALDMRIPSSSSPQPGSHGESTELEQMSCASPRRRTGGSSLVELAPPFVVSLFSCKLPENIARGESAAPTLGRSHTSVTRIVGDIISDGSQVRGAVTRQTHINPSDIDVHAWGDFDNYISNALARFRKDTKNLRNPSQ